jgi:4-amino-4-deoxy-L-arabinose transferase-like glycosyltransferase
MPFKHPSGSLAVIVLAVAAYLLGLSSLRMPTNGDEMIYAQITRATAASGHWLPLKSEMPDMVNTKPPLLFWQGLVTTDWARQWSLVALRWPSVAWTFATALLAGLVAWRATGGDAAKGVLAAAIYLALLSTYRYGRPFLTNPPETFWVFLCFFLMLWWRPRSFASRFAVPTIVGLVVGMALLTKSFAQLVPIGAGLAAWHLHECRLDWRRFLVRSLPGLAWTAALSLAIFALWFLLDPDPQAIWQEFVVHENLGKMKAGRPSYLGALLWGKTSLWVYSLTWFANAGLLALPLLGTMIRGWQQRREASDVERLLWLLVGAYFFVFLMPTQRSGRYLLEAMPAFAVLMALHWHRLLPSALATTAIGAAAVVGLIAWLSAMLVRELGGGFGWSHWAILAGAAAVAVAPLVNQRWLSALAVPAALAALLALGSFLRVFDPPLGAFPTEAVVAARGRVVWSPENFRAGEELYRFVLPGAMIRGYPLSVGRPEQGSVAADDFVILVRDLADPAPPGAIGSRIDLKGRHTMEQVLAMLRGDVMENLFSREWLVPADVPLRGTEARSASEVHPPRSSTPGSKPPELSSLARRAFVAA